jgi:ferric enterobactin receptor
MRLATTVKYLLSKKLNNIIFYIPLFFFLFQQNLKSQNYTIAFNNLSLSEALMQVSDQMNVKFAFDAGKTKEVIINREIKGNTTDELISDLLLETPYEYKYRYGRYLILEKEKGLAESVPPGCQIVGSISDAETGESLPYANIILLDNNLLTSATESGSFCLKNTTANPVHLLVRYIGYDQLDTTLSWKDPTLNLDIRLIRRPHVLDTIVVKSSRLEMVDLRNDVDFATTVDPARLIDLPLLAETDVFRMLQLLPGISYTENSSGLSIRGGSGDQNLVLFDGQTLYNLSHYYGVVSARNPKVN